MSESHQNGSDLCRGHRRSGFNNRRGSGGRQALVVSDFCRAYLDDWSPPYAGVIMAAEAVLHLDTLDAGRNAHGTE